MGSGASTLTVVGACVALVACGRLSFESAAADATDVDAVVSADGWSRIFAGDHTTCGIYKDRGYCWGRGTNDEIGDGAGLDRASPTPIALPPGKVREIVQGEGHGCAILEDTAYCWGSAPPGTGPPASTQPIAVVSLPSPVTALSAGAGHTCAIANGDVYCWGDDNAGCLGNGAIGPTTTPMRVTLPDSVTSMDTGNDHTFVMLANGTVMAWGHNDFGVFGTGSTSPAESQSPVTSSLVTGRPSVGGWHACAVVPGGTVQCWGRGTMGELGDGLSTSSASPVSVTGLANVDDVHAGGGPSNQDATCAIVAGAVSCWGNGDFGRLGNNATTSSPIPVPVQGLPDDIVELALGYTYSCARSADGTARCWGRGSLGQLGDGGAADSMVPVIVPPPDGD